MKPARRPAAQAGFQGFGGGMMAFFAELADHQTRAWFLANKTRFEREIGTPLAALVTSASLALAARDIPLTGAPKTSVFRMNRDIRFSRDKSPYKTNASAVLTRTGTKHSQGVLYIHAGHDEAFLALGFYTPEPDALAAIRGAIIAEPEGWRAMLAALASRGYELSRETQVMRLPRGYDLAGLEDLGAWVRLKSFTIARPVTVAELQHPSLVDTIADFAAAGLPLLQFGWRALHGLARP